eukprot:TRINITY_DN8120_c0_g1_i4.p1 TRINITY_DN8120_c0_g1~~TRINITY_DN8120_c0_g1_i4.p1  ORF type:complete len:251 (-),score=41.79 TRINITY_DN8120_c0_g1_i4:212-964(-)
MASTTMDFKGLSSHFSSSGFSRDAPCVRDDAPTIASLDDCLGTMSHAALEKAVCDTITALGCCATLAQTTPHHEDLVDFKAVSPEFTRLTGYSSSALVGSKLRVLNADDFVDENFEDDAKLRCAAICGRPCTVVRVYRTHSGNLFRAILHLQGLKVAFPLDDASSSCQHELDSSIWYLLGVYEDVSEFSDDEIADRLVAIRETADDVRKRIGLAVEAAAATTQFADDDDDEDDEDDEENEILVIHPEWIH